MPVAPRLILASRSPRRSELLRQIAVPFEVMPADIPEHRGAGESPLDYVERVARGKAQAIVQSHRVRTGCWVLGADTEVVLDGRVYGKPSDEAEAFEMLASLSGRTHEVISAVCLMGLEKTFAEYCVSQVTFASVSAERIASYVASGEPFGKAGAYAIQGRAAALIANLQGSYSAVMGLPLHETWTLLERAELVG